MHSLKTLGLRLLSIVIWSVGFLSFGGIVALLGAKVMNYLTNSKGFGVTNVVAVHFDRIMKPVIDLLHVHVKCVYGGHDLAPLMIGIVLALVCVASDWAAHRVRVYSLALAELRKAAESQEAARLHGETLVDPTKREALLEIYAKTKKIIEDQKKNLSFLAVDVVDSSRMKAGEDPALAERDFRQYRKLVERVIAEHKGLKAAWTPDGVMICFASLQNAVQAAQDLIKRLDCFNREVKTIKTDFKVRCGVNAGNVLFDESVRMEEMSDGSIDIAGHMQKYAEVNTIYVGKDIIENMRAEFGFRPASKQVDGCEVYEWRSSFASPDSPKS